MLSQKEYDSLSKLLNKIVEKEKGLTKSEKNVVLQAAQIIESLSHYPESKEEIDRETLKLKSILNSLHGKN